MNSGVAPLLASRIRHQRDAEMLRRLGTPLDSVTAMLRCNANASKPGITKNSRMAGMSILLRRVINLM